MSLGLAGRGYSQSPPTEDATSVPDISEFGDFQRPGEGTDSAMFFYSVTPTMDTTMTDYVRDPSGQWLADDGAKEPAVVTVQLETPKGPYRVRFNITVNDVPFRTHQEKGVAIAMEQAKTPIQDAQTVNQKLSGEVAADSEESKVAAKAYRRSDVVKKLAGYVRSQSLDSDASIDRSELQWMVTQWLPGSRVLISEKRFGLQHRSTAPLLHTISPDDSTITAAELDDVVDSLAGVDQNGDQTVQLSELSNQPQLGRGSKIWWNQHALLSQIEDADSVDQVVAINMNGESSTWSSEDVLGDREAIAYNNRIVQATPFGMLNILVVRDDRTSDSFFESGQFSIGAVVMPNPLFAFADTREDGRLDMQEIKALPERIRSLDQNSDNEVTTGELPAQITLIVTQGPWANRLTTQLSASPVVTPISEPKIPAPSWFTGMDANMDGLLARDEFLGNDSQFQEWDKDSDGMISSKEAVK